MNKIISEIKCVILVSLSICAATFAQKPDVAYTNAYAVNIRTGPGLEYEKERVIFLNTRVEVIDENAGWYEIR